MFRYHDHGYRRKWGDAACVYCVRAPCSTGASWQVCQITSLTTTATAATTTTTTIHGSIDCRKNAVCKASKNRELPSLSNTYIKVYHQQWGKQLPFIPLSRIYDLFPGSPIFLFNKEQSNKESSNKPVCIVYELSLIHI